MIEMLMILLHTFLFTTIFLILTVIALIIVVITLLSK